MKAPVDLRNVDLKSVGVTADEASAELLLAEIARRYGTPCYAYDLVRLRARATHLRQHVPAAVEVFYSLKANSSLGVCATLARCGLAADVASAGELATAVAAGFAPQRVFVAGPHKSAETVAWLRQHPEAIVSVDSASELEALSELANPAVLRLRPDFPSGAVVAAGPGCRFGLLMRQLPELRSVLASSRLRLVGYHIFAGSQVLDATTVVNHLREAFQQARKAAELLARPLNFVNLGGGFGIEYTGAACELDLAAIGDALRTLQQDDPDTQLALELGRFLVAPAGWYLTRVVGHQTHANRPAVVADGGTHQRADLCGLSLRTRAAPPLVLRRGMPLAWNEARATPTDVLGCLSLPADVLAEACPLPPLDSGDVLAFPNAGAYGLGASAAHFHGYPLPAEVAFDGRRTQLLREALPPHRVLDGQRHLEDL